MKVVLRKASSESESYLFSSSEHDQIKISLESEIACGKSELRQNHNDWAHQRGCRQLKTRPHCQGIQRKALGIWPIIMVIDIFNHSNTWLASAPLSRQPYWMPRPIPKRKTQIGFAQNWLPCYCIARVLLLSCYCIVSVLLMSCYCLVIALSLYCYRALAFSGHQAVKVIEPEQIKLFANSLQLLLLINSSKT